MSVLEHKLLGTMSLRFSSLRYDSVALETSKTLGVSLNLIANYFPLKSGNWNCLDEILCGFVNNDSKSCDCPDGSNETDPVFS